MQNPVPYKGTKPFIFVSYAHRDGETVRQIISKMQQDGFRVWFDQGIDPGTEWDQYIAEKVEASGYMIAFVSANYIASNNCKDELNYARDLEKDRLIVYLEDVALPKGMAMRMNRLQSVFRHKYTSEEDFYNTLYSANNLDRFRDAPPEKRPAAAAQQNMYTPISAVGAAPEKKPAQQPRQIQTKPFGANYTANNLKQPPANTAAANGKQKNRSKWHNIYLIPILAAVIFVIIIVSAIGSATPNSSINNSTSKQSFSDYTKITVNEKDISFPLHISQANELLWITDASSDFSKSIYIAGFSRQYSAWNKYNTGNGGSLFLNRNYADGQQTESYSGIAAFESGETICGFAPGMEISAVTKQLGDGHETGTASDGKQYICYTNSLYRLVFVYNADETIFMIMCEQA